MSLNTTPRTWVAGEKPPASIFNTEIRDALTGIQAAWTAYTPTLASVTLGTGGAATGAYMQIGKTIHFRAGFTLGTGGALTGAATITLPVVPITTERIQLAGIAYDSSATAPYSIVGILAAGSSTINLRGYPTTAGNALTAFGAAFPFTWAASDTLVISGSYEAA